MEKEQFERFKKEFAEDIEEEQVTIEILKKNKISSDILQAEVRLHKVFGDEIYLQEKKEEALNGEKEIIKLSETDIAFDNEVRKICDEIDNSEFDSKVSQILAKSEG